MPAPPPTLSGETLENFYSRFAIVRVFDNRVINIIVSEGTAFTDAYDVQVIAVPILSGEECAIYWIYDEFGSPRFYSDGSSYENTLEVPITVFPGSIAIGNNSPIGDRGFHIQFPDGTTQDSAVNRTKLTNFTALQQFSAGISSGQIIAIDPIDGTGFVASKSIAGASVRIGGIRLGYAGTSEYNTLLHNSSGSFTIFNGFSSTGSNLLNINSTKLSVNVPSEGINFISGITAPNIVYSINGCTGILGITGTENEVSVTGSCPNIIIGLPDDVVITGSLNVLGSIYIDGGTF